MPGGSVNKNWTYIQKKMDIHSKETKHTSHDKAARTSHEETAYLTKFHSNYVYFTIVIYIYYICYFQ
jgi:hypothetical protein